MRTSSLILRFSLRASAERVRAFLTDPEAFISVHPIIDRMASLTPTSHTSPTREAEEDAGQ